MATDPEDLHTEAVVKDLLEAYKRASAAGSLEGVQVAEAAIFSVFEAEAAVLTAENVCALAEATLEKPVR